MAVRKGDCCEMGVAYHERYLEALWGSDLVEIGCTGVAWLLCRESRLERSRLALASM